MKLKKSQYNVSIELLNNRFLLFNSLSRSLCLLDHDDMQALDKIDNVNVAPATESSVGQLLNQGFVVPESLDELEIVRSKYDEQRGYSEAVTLTVCPTLSCNFGCDYCFQGADKPIEQMSEEVQNGVVRLSKRLLLELPHLKTFRSMWYGGEPLLRPRIIYSLADKLIEQCRDNGIDYSGAMISNGSKMTRKVAQSLFQRGLRKVQITLDGDKDNHDSRRHYLSKKGSYDIILRNMKEWVFDIPIDIDLRVNIDERNKDAIYQLIDDMAEQGLHHLPNLHMYFAPVESVTVGCHNVADKMLKKLEFGKLEADLLRYAFERGLANLPYAPQFMGICSAVKNYDYIVVPNGDVHKCWDTVSFPEKRIGTVFDIDGLFENKSEKHLQWDRFYPFDHKSCRECKILPNCSSFCAHKFINAEEAIGDASLPCPSLKYSLNEKLILLAEKQGYITEDDYTPEMVQSRPELLCKDEKIAASSFGNKAWEEQIIEVQPASFYAAQR